MARLPAAFALAAVLVVAAGIGPGNAQGLQPNGCLPFPITLFPYPPVRIISKGDPTLSIAADGNGGVVLVKTNCQDLRQVSYIIILLVHPKRTHLNLLFIVIINNNARCMHVPAAMGSGLLCRLPI